MRKHSNESRIVLDDDSDDKVMIMIESVTSVTTADFSYQHDGFFETTFDEDDIDNTSKTEKDCL